MTKWKKYYSSKKYRHLRKKRTIFRNQFFYFSILGIITFTGLFYLLIFSPIFQIKTITIQGAYFIDASEVEQKIEKITERNILLFPTKSIFVSNRKKIKSFVLEKFFPVKEITIKKKLPNTLLISIQERTAKAVSCAEERCFLVDNQGFAFYSLYWETIPPSLPIILFENELAQQDRPLGQKTLKFILSIYSNLKQEGNIVVQSFRVSPAKIAAKVAESNLMLYFSPQKCPDLQVGDLFLLFKNEISPIEYIDLRFNKIFYK